MYMYMDYMRVLIMPLTSKFNTWGSVFWQGDERHHSRYLHLWSKTTLWSLDVLWDLEICPPDMPKCSSIFLLINDKSYWTLGPKSLLSSKQTVLINILIHAKFMTLILPRRLFFYLWQSCIFNWVVAATIWWEM